jgi:hypothetical protein
MTPHAVTASTLPRSGAAGPLRGSVSSGAVQRRPHPLARLRCWPCRGHQPLRRGPVAPLLCPVLSPMTNPVPDARDRPGRPRKLTALARA